MPLYLSTSSLDWALKHVEKYGDTDVFPVPFEYEAIRYSWDDRLKKYLAKIDLCNYQVRPYRKCLTPKHRFGFRISTQLDPFDTLLYLASVYEIGADIESKRVPVKQNVVYSFRFDPDNQGRIFNPLIGHNSYIQRSAELAFSNDYPWIVVADIADFFPRIYLHPLENALLTCTPKSDHAKAIIKFIKQWSFGVSYGIPVGQSASRLLAELTIADVDQALISEGYIYCRFTDDYCLFCKTKKEAYQALAFLANTLFENHGLTLQQHKTRILPLEKFCERYLRTDRGVELDSLSEKFQKILDSIGIDNWYEEIEYDDLAPETQKEIDSLNLKDILDEQIARGDELDLGVTRFVLRRLGQINDIKAVRTVFKNIETLYPVFKEALVYISKIRRLDSAIRQKIGNFLIELMETSILGHLKYHRCWIFNLFTHNTEWDNESRFQKLYNSNNDEFSRRELICAMGRAGQSHWFKRQKRSISQFDPWQKRALLAAASCLPGDEAKHWYRSIYRQLDELEKVVVEWAKANPY